MTFKPVWTKVVIWCCVHKCNHQWFHHFSLFNSNTKWLWVIRLCWMIFIFEELLHIFCSFTSVVLNIMSQSDDSWYTTFWYLGNVNTLQPLLWKDKELITGNTCTFSFDPVRQFKWCGLHVAPYCLSRLPSLSICVYILTPGFSDLGIVLYLHENLIIFFLHDKSSVMLKLNV